MNIREQVPLAPLTTFLVGGSARYFAEVLEASELPELFAYANARGVPVFVLGGGSNILVDDGGYAGLVLQMSIKEMSMTETGDDVLVTVGAGMLWDIFVAQSINKGYSGAENLSLIPGTVGGAVVQNIGAYGCEVQSIVEWVEVYDPTLRQLRTLTNAACTFGYRDSIFKHEGFSLVITRVQFRLHKRATLHTLYKDISAYFLERGIVTPTVHDVRRAVVDVRTAKFPILGVYGTAGSFFKNPVVSGAIAERFLTQHPAAPAHDVGDGLVKLSAAWIIDNVLHMRGVRDDAVGCWQEQALVIVNYGGASSEQIKKFVSGIQKKCLSETNIALEREVIFVDRKK